MQIVNQEEFEIAKKIAKLREDNEYWYVIQERFGMAREKAITVCRKYGFYNLRGKSPSLAGRSDKDRNKLILDYVNSEEGKKKTQEKVAEYFMNNGRPDINRGVVNGVIARARNSGLTVPPKRYGIGPSGSPKKSKKMGAMQEDDGLIRKTYELPPRTPELLARGRIVFEDLTPGACRYTPSENQPFLYCGEPAQLQPNGRFTSWCEHCATQIVYAKNAVEVEDA